MGKQSNATWDNVETVVAFGKGTEKGQTVITGARITFGQYTIR
jgi:hypothetical protein